jgi:Co/Zn/Cd efflux system component
MQYLNNVKSDHSHQFDEGNPLAQKKILIATILTGVMMVFEILEDGSLIPWLYWLMDGI